MSGVTIRLSRKDATWWREFMGTPYGWGILCQEGCRVIKAVEAALAAAPRPAEEAETVPDPAWGEELRIYTDGLDGKDSLALYGILERQKKRLLARAAELEAAMAQADGSKG